MAYLTEPNPYEGSPESMTDTAIKKAFAATMASLPQRIDAITRHIEVGCGVKLSPQSSDREIDAVPELIAKLGSVWDPSRPNSKVLRYGEKPSRLNIFGPAADRLTPTPETEQMVFDAALLWGEMFLVRYPEAHWAIGRKPKSSVDYGDPVLVGPYQYLLEFGVRRQLSGLVGGLLLNEPSDWPLTELMNLRAFDLGLAPDPRRRVMP